MQASPTIALVTGAGTGIGKAVATRGVLRVVGFGGRPAEIPVEEILAGGRSQPHKLTPFAHVDGARVTYPGEPQLELSL